MSSNRISFIQEVVRSLQKTTREIILTITIIRFKENHPARRVVITSCDIHIYIYSMLLFYCTMLSCFLHLLFILFCCFCKDSISESSDNTLLSCFLGDVPNDMECIEYMISLIVSIFFQLSDSTLNGGLLICDYTRRFPTHHFEEASEDTHKRILCL